MPVFGFLDIRKDLVPALLPILEDCLLLREGAEVDVVCCPETVVPAEVLPIVLIFGAGSCGAGGVTACGGGVGAGAGAGVLSTRPPILSAVGEDSAVGRVSTLRGGGAGVGLLGLLGGHMIIRC